MNVKKLIRLLLQDKSRLYTHLKRSYLKQDVTQGKACITAREIKTLQAYAQKARVGIVEIGVLDAGTTREMGLVAHVPIYGIDPLIPDSMDEHLQGDEDIIRANMKFYKQFYFFKAYSHKIVATWDNAFDVVFIDGDHRYDAVKQDFNDWFPLLESHGYVAFHDAAPVTSDPHNQHKGYDGPIKLVAELRHHDQLTYIETQDSLVIFQKNK